jgi:hypothetical protein
MRELETGAPVRWPASVNGWLSASHPGGAAR